MKRLFLFVLFVVAIFAPIANAWELNISGDYEYRYRYIARTGANDLFGNINTAQSQGSSGLTTVGLAGPIPTGPMTTIVAPEGYSSKGSSGAILDQKFTLYPSLRINPAITIRSVYSLYGNLNAPLNQYTNNWVLPTSRGEEAEAGFAYGRWNMAWVTMQTPLGIIDFGRRPFGFGLGWGGYHINDYATSSLQLTVPYGPMSFLFAYDLADTGEATDAKDVRNVNRTPLTVASSSDTNEMRKWNAYAGLKYANANLDIGTLGRVIYYQNVHSTPAIAVTTLRDDQTGSFAANFLGPQDSGDPIYGDVAFWQQTSYMRYFNGRFFFNAEYAWQYFRAKRTGGREISGWPKAYMAEFGAVAGPTKTTVGYFYSSGHDRSGAILNTSSQNGTTPIGVQVLDKWSQFMTFGGRDEAIKPYTYLIGLYGGGNNAYDRCGDPTFLDFRAAAVRLDYAIAANLNLFGSFIYAQRASTTGTWKGQFNGGVGTTITAGDNVPDTNLGQELNVGIDWKLLENVTASTRFAYWAPGAWFKTAYQDLASVNVSASSAGGNSVQAIPVTPDRSIDPLMGAEFNLTVNF